VSYLEPYPKGFIKRLIYSWVLYRSRYWPAPFKEPIPQ